MFDAVGFLPPEIVNHPKMGFLLPRKDRMKKELYEFCDQKITQLAARGFFKEKEILALRQRFNAGDKTINWPKIWLLVILENYIQGNDHEQ